MSPKKPLSTKPKLFSLSNLRPLYYLCNVVGQLHPNAFNKDFLASNVYKCYSGLIALLISIWYIIVITDEPSDAQFMKTTSKTMDIMTQTVFTIAVIHSIYSNIFQNSKKIHTVIKKMYQVDAYLNNLKKSFIVKRTGYYFWMVVEHIILFTLLAFDIYWFETGGLMYLDHTYIEQVLLYQTFVTYLIISNFFIELKNRFKSTNLCLLHIKSYKTFDPLDVGDDIASLTIVYGLLTEIVDLFNDIFGWQILLMFIYTLLVLLRPLNIIAIFIPRLSEIQDKNFSIAAFLVVIIDYTLFIIANFIVIARFSHHIYKEEQETASICYRILHDAKGKQMQNNKNCIAEKIEFLAQESTLRCPQISAAGFFNVDYTMIFLLFTSLTTYIVVLIQFNL